jgi:hypothetical protein
VLTVISVAACQGAKPAPPAVSEPADSSVAALPLEAKMRALVSDTKPLSESELTQVKLVLKTMAQKLPQPEMLTSEEQSADALDDFGRSTLSSMKKTCASHLSDPRTLAQGTSERAETISGQSCPVKFESSLKATDRISKSENTVSGKLTIDVTRSLRILSDELRRESGVVEIELRSVNSEEHAGVIFEKGRLTSGKTYNVSTVDGTYNLVSGRVEVHHQSEELITPTHSAYNMVTTLKFPQGTLVIAIFKSRERAVILANGEPVTEKKLREEFHIGF